MLSPIPRPPSRCDIARSPAFRLATHEHMRLAQADILDFSRNPEYQPRKFPTTTGRLPAHRPATPPGTPAFQRFQSDMQEMQELIADTKQRPTGEHPHSKGQTLLHEASWWPTTIHTSGPVGILAQDATAAGMKRSYGRDALFAGATVFCSGERSRKCVRFPRFRELGQRYGTVRRASV